MDIAVALPPRLPDFRFSSIKIFADMAAAKSVIASRYPDTKSVIASYYKGILIEPGDKFLLTQAIMEPLEDNELRERLVDRRVRHAGEIHVVVQQTLAISAAVLLVVYV